MLQYLRKVRATFNGGYVVNPGGISRHEIKIAFNISKGISSSANTAEIEIWNLQESSRNSMGKEFDEITLEAGYMPPQGGAGNVGVIFKGNIRDVEHTRDGSNIITRISCGDGDKALRRATISKSYRKGTPVKEVVEDIYKELEKQGVKRGEWKFPDDMEQSFKRPYATCGSCAREMDTLGRGRQFYWNIQNGTMEIIPGDGFIGTIVSITPQSGMIGVPTITDNGVKVSALLNPEIRPNRRVQVESQVLEMNAANGVYRVSQCDYSGDNREGEFRVDVTGESVQGGKVDEGKKK
jgi:hypothetical protein